MENSVILRVRRRAIWIKFSWQENCRETLRGSNGKFDWSNVPQLYEMWETF